MITRARLLSILPPLMLLASCVTINIYFPAAAAEKAADQVIDKVWGTEPEQKKQEPQGDKTSWRQDTPRRGGLVDALLDVIVAPAHAAQVDFTITSPEINRLTSAMEARHATLQAYYDSGAIGLTRDGLVKVLDPKRVPLKDRGRINKLVDDENRERNALYKETARVNGHPEWEQEIRSTFARRWVTKARAGWWYEDAAGNWKRK